MYQIVILQYYQDPSQDILTSGRLHFQQPMREERFNIQAFNPRDLIHMEAIFFQYHAQGGELECMRLSKAAAF